ncbi:hypothetical protein ACL598_20495 [Bordetella bronchialis]|uniref:hypothetical protein n=1 Tax=Bordetella bronchialis TaxID=463025 RepID=UPI003D05F817
MPSETQALRSLLCEFRNAELTAQRLMRAPLRRGEFSEVQALLDASRAAQRILSALVPGT